MEKNKIYQLMYSIKNEKKSENELLEDFKTTLSIIKDFDINFYEQDGKNDKHFLNEIIETDYNYIIKYVIDNYKDKIVFSDYKSSQAVLLYLSEKGTYEDYKFFDQLEKENFENSKLTSNYHGEKRWNRSKFIKAALLNNDKRIFINYIKSQDMNSIDRLDNLTIRDWFLDERIINIIPPICLYHINDIKDEKNIDVYKKIINLKKKVLKYSLFDEILLQNNGSPTDIVNKLKLLNKAGAEPNLIKKYIVNNILYYNVVDRDFNEKEIEDITKIAKKYYNNSENYRDFFRERIINSEFSYNSSGKIPFILNKSSFIIYNNIIENVELKKETAKNFLDYIFNKVYREYLMEDNLKIIFFLCKNLNIEIDNKYKNVLYNIDPVILTDNREENIYQFISPSLFNENLKTADYTNLFKKDLIKGPYCIRRANENYSKSSFFCASNEEMELSIINKTENKENILKELSLIELSITFNTDIQPVYAERIQNKLKSFYKLYPEAYEISKSTILESIAIDFEKSNINNELFKTLLTKQILDLNMETKKNLNLNIGVKSESKNKKRL